jgi:hypothetical protein
MQTLDVSDCATFDDDDDEHDSFDDWEMYGAELESSTEETVR